MQREKVEQAHIVQLLRTIGATVYVLGTRRRSGDYQGTMQSPGIPDLLAFVPQRVRVGQHLLFIECKAGGGRLRPEQVLFRTLCQQAGIEHVVGDLDAVIAWAIEHNYLSRDSVPHYRQPAGGPR